MSKLSHELGTFQKLSMASKVSIAKFSSLLAFESVWIRKSVNTSTQSPQESGGSEAF